MPHLERLINPNLFWDRLLSIEPSENVPVFDRHVPTTHNFIANGIVVHNSGAIENDADVIGLLWNKEQEDEDGANTNCPVSLCIAKQRNGPTGDIPLVFRKHITRFESAAKI